MPVANHDLEELGIFASQPCATEDMKNYEPSPGMIQEARNSSTDERPHLIQLQNERDELIDKANKTHNTIKFWMSAVPMRTRTSLVRNVTHFLQIPPSQHSDLNEEENFRLHTLLQFSSFALFLKKFENETAFYNNSDIIQELRLKIMKTSCTVRKLLPAGMNAVIMTYAEQDLLEHIIPPLKNETWKRVICCIAINTMLDTFMHIEISADQGSVRIVYNYNI